MINITSVAVTASVENPDKSSISSKSQINISVSTFDISASGLLSPMKLTRDSSEIILLNDSENDDFDTYYTPIYTEKLNYSVWKTTVNKSFRELGLE